MVWPGMNQVEGMPNLASSASSRSVPTVPKSPREIIVGVVAPRAIDPDVLSRSKVRQTKCCGILPGLMNADQVGANWLADFTYMTQHYDWGVLTYTVHPHVIGRGHRMAMLERLVAQLRAGGAIFVTMEQAVGAYRERYPQGRSERGG